MASFSKGKEIAKEQAEWLLDAIAVATQNPIFDRDSSKFDPVACEAILLNGEKAVTTGIEKWAKWIYG
jgi:hypothetical protein